MAIDMSQFHQVFFEEAVEHLSTMESLLLHLDPQHPDPEQLEDLSRAAHSIRGSGGTFGFRDLAELAQEVEALVESVRKGSGRLSGELVRALREACGALRALLAGYRGEGALEADAAAYAIALLRGFSTDRGEGRRKAAPQPQASLPPVRNRKVSPQEAASNAAPAPDRAALAGELGELAQRTATATGEVMALIEAAGAGGLREVTEAVRGLGEAIEQNAALVERAAANADLLRESFRALVRTIADQALSPSGGRPVAARLAQSRPLPKFRRASGKAEGDKEWPES